MRIFSNFNTKLLQCRVRPLYSSDIRILDAKETMFCAAVSSKFVLLILFFFNANLCATSAPAKVAERDKVLSAKESDDVGQAKKFAPCTNLMLKPVELWDKSKNGIANKAEFKRDFIRQIASLEKEHPKLNAIPIHDSKKILRVMTYNVHGFMPPTKEFRSRPTEQDFKNILNVIKTIAPDIVVLQEFNESFKFGKYPIYQWFEHIGYKYHVLAKAPKDKPYGVAILSKVPFKDSPYLHNFNNRTGGPRDIRSFAKVEIDLSKYGHRNLVIYGTHLEVSDPDRRIAEIQELKKATNNYDRGKNVIIAADFNESRNGRALKILESQQDGGCFQDCFSAAHMPEPYFTHWTGRSLDFIFLKTCYPNKGKLQPDWDLPINGVYLYYSAASDHMPIIMDIKFA